MGGLPGRQDGTFGRSASRFVPSFFDSPNVPASESFLPRHCELSNPASQNNRVLGLSAAAARLSSVSPHPQIVRFDREHLEGVIGLFAHESWSYAHDEQRTWRAFTAPGSITLVAVGDDDRVVGIAQALGDGEIQAFLAVLLIARIHRLTGIGRSLVNEMLAHTRGLDSTPSQAPTRSTRRSASERFPGSVSPSVPQGRARLLIKATSRLANETRATGRTVPCKAWRPGRGGDMKMLPQGIVLFLFTANKSTVHR